jgi:hypothetical protein
MELPSPCSETNEAVPDGDFVHPEAMLNRRMEDSARSRRVIHLFSFVGGSGYPAFFP